MMNNSMLRLVSALLLISASSCGGGGGSDAKFAGMYDVSLVIVRDSCGIRPANDTLNTVHEVNQVDEIIALRSGNLHFSGTVDEDGEGFTAIAETPTMVQGCNPSLSAIVYAPATGSSDFNVGLAFKVSCGRLECYVGYGGVANRL